MQGSKGQGHLQAHIELEAFLGSLRPCLGRRKREPVQRCTMDVSLRAFNVLIVLKMYVCAVGGVVLTDTTIPHCWGPKELA